MRAGRHFMDRRLISRSRTRWDVNGNSAPSSLTFNLPERFDMTYIGEDGQEHRPYMIHRALLGSMERFFGVLIEHYGRRIPSVVSASSGGDHPHS